MASLRNNDMICEVKFKVQLLFIRRLATDLLADFAIAFGGGGGLTRFLPLFAAAALADLLQ